MSPILGGYCGGVPPLPIPNRAVKPAIADGTAMQCGRVGSRLFLMSVLRFGQPIRRTLFFVCIHCQNNLCFFVMMKNVGKSFAGSRIIVYFCS